MDMLVKQVMRRSVRTIAPEVTLPELEEAFVKQGVSGFPVVDKGELVGIASRSDHVHRVLVTEDNRLLGIVSALDLVRLIANGRCTSNDGAT